MELTIECFHSLCELSKFVINGVDAEYEDFGDKFDDSPSSAPAYGCGNMHFEPRLATQEVLDKYNINITEYNEICDKLNCLSFGCCGWCS